MHCHTFYSHDSICSPESLIKSAKRKGLDGVALTDHNTTKGWERAEKAAKENGIMLIKGEEIKIKENGKTIGEILAYFLNKEINPKGKTVGEVIKEIKEQGGMAIIAHPYHWKKPFKKLEEYKHSADGVEVFNARSQSKSGNQRSFEFAIENNLSMTAGSDCHTPFEVGSACIEADVKTIEEFRKAILEKKVKIWGKQTTPLIQVFAGLSKAIHLFVKY